MSKDYPGIVELLSHSTFAREHLEVARRLADAGRCREARTVLEQRMPDETLAPKLATVDADCHLAAAEDPPKRASIGTAANPVGPLPIPLERPRRIGLGLAVGATSDEDLIAGARALVHLVPAGPGEVRAIGSLFYTRINDGADPYHHTNLYALGGALEYAATLARPFTVAAGIGAGFDLRDDSYEDSLAKAPWFAARVSPTLRYHAFDLGLHFQLVYNDRLIVLGEVGVDYWVW